LSITRVKASSITQGLPKGKTALTGNSVILPGSYESIATASGTGSSGTITFSSISSAYSHLQLRVLSATTRVGGASGSGALQFNSDTTGTNYYTHALYADGATVQAASYNENYGLWYYGSTTTNIAAVIDILDYANTNKYKTVREIIGFDQNGTGQVALISTLWKNTAAISTLVLTAPSYNFGSGARFALYGIK
jgi:hypothetical protein